MIKEDFLHFVWKLQYYYKKDLFTVDGEPLVILNPGRHNTDAGPDFSNARIKIGTIEWVGNIEIHTRSSDWRLHKHQKDELYTNIILHVVYTDDEPVKRLDSSLIPTLELKTRIEEKMLVKYASVITNTSSISCHAHFESVPSIIKASMQERAITERLMSKSELVIELLHRNNNDWQETNYQWLAKNFGFKINADPFLRLAKALPFKLLLKHRNNPLQVEALLFGQAGFLEEEAIDEYHQKLKSEFDFLSHKYSLKPLQLSKSEWKFLRIRPANFPTIRIAQFSALIAKLPELVTNLTEFQSVKEMYTELEAIKLSDYWSKHHRFGEQAELKLKTVLGKESIQNIIINTVAVIYFAVGREKSIDELKEKAVTLMEFVPAESNKIIREWNKVGMSCSTAFESQGVLQLYNNYCVEKRCLECEIGASILREEIKEYVSR